MIICGFPGTGKTQMAKVSRWVDLESTPFDRNWLLYAQVAKHMSDQGYDVMVSTHRELLDALEQIETRYTAVIPPIADKTTYLMRYLCRGDSDEFRNLIAANWERWITDIIETSTVLKTIVILPKDGCICAWANMMRGEEDGN